MPKIALTITSSVPTVTWGALPAKVTGVNVYATPEGGGSSYYQYLGNQTGTSANMVNPAASSGVAPPSTNTAGVSPPGAPSVNASGGGYTGGQMAPGNYSVVTTYVTATGETTPSSPASFTVTVAVPQVGFPTLPKQVTGQNVYLWDTVGQVHQYATGITATTYNLSQAIPSNTTGPPNLNQTMIAPPGAPTFSYVSSGTLAAQYGYIFTTYKNQLGETTISAGSYVQIPANEVLAVTSPVASSNASDWNLYWANFLGTGPGLIAGPIAIGTNWQQGTSALAPGAAPPTTNGTIIPSPTTAATINLTGGGNTGGLFPPGSYQLAYTYTGSGETAVGPDPTPLSPESNRALLSPPLTPVGVAPAGSIGLAVKDSNGVWHLKWVDETVNWSTC